MTPAIELSGVVRTFGKVRALDGLDLSVAENEILGLLGPNGSGKTTLIRVIAGLLRANAGMVRVLGLEAPSRCLAAKIGYMTQSPALYEDLSVRDNLVFFGRLYGLSRAEAARNALDLAALVSLQEKIEVPVRHLSGGMRQRTNLACALMHRPAVLLLDEPTVGVDPKLRRYLWEHFRRLNETGTTILVSTHIMDEVERCHRVAMIDQGRVIAAGAPAELCRAVGAASIEDAFLAYSEGADGKETREGKR
ncbi:MAG: ABC transporter ATP-binding protein [Bacteroidota bacterium]